MPKNIHTPRDELICGKLDNARHRAANAGDYYMCELLDDIRKDAERMEAKLVSRKDEVAALTSPKPESVTVDMSDRAKAQTELGKLVMCWLDNGGNNYITNRHAVAKLSGKGAMSIAFDEHLEIIKSKISEPERLTVSEFIDVLYKTPAEELPEKYPNGIRIIKGAE